MSTYKCPECGNPILLNERHCANCDYDVTDAEYAALVPAQPANPIVEKPTVSQPTTSQNPVATTGIDTVMAHGNVDASTHHTEDNSTLNIDNSKTVHNTNQTVTNTFIIMGGGTAPMPQNMDPQIADAIKQAQQIAQPTTQPAAPTPPVTPTQPKAEEVGQKGIGSIDGRRPEPPKTPKKWWIGIVVVALIAVAAVAVLGGKEEQPPTQSTTTTQAPKANTPKANTPKANTPKATTPKAVTAAPAATPAKTTSASAAVPKSPTPTANQKPAEVKPKDAKYEAGMSAYKAGDGLAAIQAFKASGSKESLRMLGKIYEEGCGSVEANAMMARKYYKEAENK